MILDLHPNYFVLTTLYRNENFSNASLDNLAMSAAVL
jgi:hypothetical protein